METKFRRNHSAGWSRPHVPAMRSARVPIRVGRLRLVQSDRHPPREFVKHTKEASQKQRRRGPRTTSTPLTVDPLSTPNVSNNNFPTSSSRMPSTHYTTQERSLRTTHVTPNRRTASHTPACARSRLWPSSQNPSPHSTMHTKHVATGHAWSVGVRNSFSSKKKRLDTFDQICMLQENDTRENERDLNEGVRGAQLAQQNNDCVLLGSHCATIHSLRLCTVMETTCHQRVDAEKMSRLSTHVPRKTETEPRSSCSGAAATSPPPLP